MGRRSGYLSSAEASPPPPPPQKRGTTTYKYLLFNKTFKYRKSVKQLFAQPCFKLPFCSTFRIYLCVAQKIWNRESQSKPHVPASVQ